MSTLLIRSATSQPSSYTIVLTRLGGPRSRPNPHLKYAGIELATSWSAVRYADHYTNEAVCQCMIKGKKLVNIKNNTLRQWSISDINILALDNSHHLYCFSPSDFSSGCRRLEQNRAGCGSLLMWTTERNHEWSSAEDVCMQMKDQGRRDLKGKIMDITQYKVNNLKWVEPN